MHQIPLIVLGADLDGLATALALAHQGFPVTVLERGAREGVSPDLVVLTPAAVAELAVLGLADAVAARGAEPAELRQCDGRSGVELRAVRMGPSVRERYGCPLLTVRRSEARALMVAACDADEMIHVEYGCRVTAVEDVGDGVLVTLADGRHLRAEALVGADGATSRVRGLLGGGHPVSPPYVVHSGPGPALVGPPAIRLWTSSEMVVAQVPVGHHASEVSVVVPTEYHDETRHRADDVVPATLLAQHHPEARAVAACALDGETSRVYRHYAPLASWSRHRITVLGAAAVPMLPHAALATSAGLVDAGVLGAAFDRADGRILHALDGYVRSRAPAWGQLAQRSDDHARLCHAEGLLRRLRDRVWAGAPGDALADLVELPVSG